MDVFSDLTRFDGSAVREIEEPVMWIRTERRRNRYMAGKGA